MPPIKSQLLSDAWAEPLGPQVAVGVWRQRSVSAKPPSARPLTQCRLHTNTCMTPKKSLMSDSSPYREKMGFPALLNTKMCFFFFCQRSLQKKKKTVAPQSPVSPLGERCRGWGGGASACGKQGAFCVWQTTPPPPPPPPTDDDDDDDGNDDDCGSSGGG